MLNFWSFTKYNIKNYEVWFLGLVAVTACYVYSFKWHEHSTPTAKFGLLSEWEKTFCASNWPYYHLVWPCLMQFSHYSHVSLQSQAHSCHVILIISHFSIFCKESGRQIHKLLFCSKYRYEKYLVLYVFLYFIFHILLHPKSKKLAKWPIHVMYTVYQCLGRCQQTLAGSVHWRCRNTWHGPELSRDWYHSLRLGH